MNGERAWSVPFSIVTRTSTALAFAFLLSACGFQSIGDLGNDNPRIREKQRASVARFPPEPIRGQAIGEFFRSRVGLIHTSSKSQGRAVPVSRDGYYLTAWHVIRGEEEFFLSDTVLLKPLPDDRSFKPSDHFRTDLHRGRLVWHDPGADLAVVKFDLGAEEPFAPRVAPPEVGSAAFSGASGNNSGTHLVKTGGSLEDGFGNGPFQTAGEVTQTGRIGRDSPCHWFRSTLVSRRGMSGGPVVDSAGTLVGIISRIDINLLGISTRDRPAHSTVFTMLPKRELERVIAADRAD